MFYPKVFILCLVIFSEKATGKIQDEDTNENSIDSNSTPVNNEVVKEVIGKECRTSYSPFCIKLGLMKLVGRGEGVSIPILPGVELRSSPGPKKENKMDIFKEPHKIDVLLLQKLSDYFSSLSINLKILDKSSPLEFAKAYFGDSASTGRGKNKYGGALAAAGLMSGGTLLAVGMAALAAMAGKALMASLLALLLAGISAIGKGGGGEEKTTYEIVAKPIVSHHNTHSSEIVHGGHHYRRSFDPHSIVYAKHVSS